MTWRLGRNSRYYFILPFICSISCDVLSCPRRFVFLRFKDPVFSSRWSLMMMPELKEYAFKIFTGKYTLYFFCLICKIVGKLSFLFNNTIQQKNTRTKLGIFYSFLDAALKLNVVNIFSP